MEEWDCAGCGADTQSEYYMVHDEIWEQVGVDPLLCIGCLENRLGRRLHGGDFTHCALNVLNMGWEKSDRLLNRLSRFENTSQAGSRCDAGHTGGGAELRTC